MAYLADTHAILWYFQTPEKVPRPWLSIFESTDAVFVSTASFWEVAIKAGLGKLSPRADFADHVLANGFTLLPMHLPHIAALQELPYLKEHRDPFDRMLIAQAQVEGLTIMTMDAKFRLYDVPMI